MQSLALVGQNAKFLKKKKKATDFIDMGVTNMVGASLTKETADFIGE